VWWSAIRDAQDWSPAQSTQCDYQDLQFGGQVQRIIGSVEYAIVFQETIIRRMNYVGTPAVFDIQPVDRRRGTAIPTSVTSWGRLIFFIAPEGFMAFDGVESTPIGENYIDDYFYDSFDPSQHYLVHAAIDPVLKLVYWSYPGADNIGEANEVLVYHWPERKWSHLDVGLTCIGNMGRPGFTLEGLDAVSTDVDNDTLLGPSLDSDKWKGGPEAFGAFDTSNYLGFFDGSTAPAVITTGEAQIMPGRRVQINGVRPHIQSGLKSHVDISVGHRKTPLDDVTYSSSNPLNVDGEAPQRVEDRYHRVRISLSASMSWSLATGVTLEYEETGDR